MVLCSVMSVLVVVPGQTASNAPGPGSVSNRWGEQRYHMPREEVAQFTADSVEVLSEDETVDEALRSSAAPSLSKSA